MTADLSRLRAAQAKADEVVASLPNDLTFDGPRLMVAVIDTETHTRLATAFVAYQVESTPVLRLVGGEAS